jgi:hypothetical protein
VYVRIVVSICACPSRAATVACRHRFLSKLLDRFELEWLKLEDRPELQFRVEGGL